MPTVPTDNDTSDLPDTNDAVPDAGTGKSIRSQSRRFAHAQKYEQAKQYPMPASQASDQAKGLIVDSEGQESFEIDDLPYVPSPDVAKAEPSWLSDIPKAELIGSRSPAESLSFLEEIPKNKTQTQESFESFADSDPDHNAKVAKYSQQFGQPPEFIDKNIQKAEKAAQSPGPSAFEEMEREYPGSTKFYSKPENMAVAHDDIPQLNAVEGALQERSYIGEVWGSVKSGAANIGKSLAQSPAMAYQIGNPEFPQLPVPGLIGLRIFRSYIDSTPQGRQASRDGRVPEFLYKNTVTETIGSYADKNRPADASSDVIKEAAKGNYKVAARALSFQVAQNIPQLALLLMNPAAGLMMMGSTSSSSKNAENLEKGIEPNKALANAAITGTIEAGIESFGGVGVNPLKETIKNLVNSTGKETAKQVLKDGLKQLGKSSSQEGIEEFATSVSHDLVDQAMDVNPEAMDGIILRAANSFLVGAGSGLAISSIPQSVATAQSLKQVESKARVESDKGSYIKMGEESLKSKLWGRSKESFVKFVDTAAEKSGSGFVYIAPEALEVYFQGKNESAIELMTKVGTLEQFNKAKESGDYVKIPLGTWTAATLETTHFNALANDIKFDPEHLTANEVKQDDALAEQKAKEVDAESARPIFDSTKRKLLDAGMKASEAEHDAALHEAFINTMAQRSKRYTPEQLAEKFPLTIERTSKEAGLTIAVPDGLSPEDAQVWKEVSQGAKGDVMQMAKNVLENIPDVSTDAVAEALGLNKQQVRLLGWKGRRKGKAVETNYSKEDILAAANNRRGVDASGKELFQSGDTDPRGRIIINGKSFYIGLFKNADKSTFLHESAHMFLEVMNSLATEDGADSGLAKDWAEIEKYLGLEPGQDIETTHHEKWAKSFEAFLREGNAPSEALKKAFRTFRTWLTAVYKRYVELGVELSPEIRDVMSRMLATEEESGFVSKMQMPLFTDPVAMGMSESKAAKYDQAIAEAKDHAIDSVNKELIAHHDKVRSAEYNRERDDLIPEIREIVEAKPEYQTIEKLKELPLSFDSVAEFGKDVHREFPKGTVATKKSGEGLPVAAAAELFGVSPQELVSLLTNTPDKAQAIESLADQEMAKRYPDLLENVHEEVLKASQNQSRAKLLRFELEHLLSNNLPVFKDAIRRVARRVPTDKAVREQAKKIIGGKKVGELSPYTYQRNAARSAKEAGIALAKGDINGAFDAKLKELLNLELHNAAIEAQEAVDKAQAKFKKISQSDEKLAKSRNMDAVNAARGVLSMYGIGDYPKFQAELDKMRDYDPDAYAVVLGMVGDATVDAAPIDEISFDQFQAMRDSVYAIWDMAREMRSIEIEGKREDTAVVIGALSTRLAELSPGGDKPGVHRAISDKERKSMDVSSLLNVATRVEHWAYAMDKGDINGAFTKYLVRPVLDAATRYRTKRIEVMEHLAKIVETLKIPEPNKIISAPEIQYEFKKPELIMAILHSGNDSNLRKLLLGRKWGTVDEQGNLNRSAWDAFINRAFRDGLVTKEDMDAAQAIWNINESLKPDAQKAHKKMYGHYFNEITANPIQTPWGEYKGGYMPATPDYDLSIDARVRKAQNELDESPFQMLPTTGRGFSKNRQDNYSTPLSLDFGKLKNHMDQVVKFTYLEPAVKDAAKIIKNREFQSAMTGYDNSAIDGLLMPWLKRAATQRIQSKGWSPVLDRGATAFRKSATIQMMVLNVVNAMQNTTALSPASTRVNPKYLAGALARYMTSKEAFVKSAMESSEYMRARMSTRSQELLKSIDEFTLNPTKFEKFKETAINTGYILDRMTNGMVEVIIWGGAFNQHMIETNNHDESVNFANATVRQTTAGMNPEDVSNFQSNTPMVSLFTMFTGFFNTQANLLKSELTIAREVGGTEGAAMAAKAMALIVTVPAIASTLIFRVMSGKGLDEDDDGNYIDDFMDIFFGSQFKYMAALIPGGSIVNSALNRLNDKPYDDKISMSPAISSIERAIGAPLSGAKALKGRGGNGKALREGALALGLITGLPLAPLAKPLAYTADVKEHKIRVKNPADAFRGIITGTGKK